MSKISPWYENLPEPKEQVVYTPDIPRRTIGVTTILEIAVILTRRNCSIHVLSTNLIDLTVLRVVGKEKDLDGLAEELGAIHTGFEQHQSVFIQSMMFHRVIR